MRNFSLQAPERWPCLAREIAGIYGSGDPALKKYGPYTAAEYLQ
jgi:hypothetical protein